MRDFDKFPDFGKEIGKTDVGNRKNKGIPWQVACEDGNDNGNLIIIMML